ncbi:putrescine transport system permease protein [Inquilinus ginsengisoli]|uniref:Putrescine transport system permease protein n=1 Tax=Inquilinus ginsengisoli TaxID=363840 RepID=A0ABU1JRP1_9PROT|nr:ABC transporter permease subunit [Inquilinus ginsengisoli]MDR6291272.1 putrescine transport system permease protein [Inquilinus ginsengisoli]
MTASDAADAATPKAAAGPSLLRRLSSRLGRNVVIAIPYVWLFLFFLVPFIIVLKIAFADKVIGQPPYTPLFDWIDDVHLGISLNLGNLQYLLDDPLYVSAYFSSIKIAAISTALSLLIGYPMAYAIARSSQQWRVPLLMLVILPFWTSFLIRVYAWIGILQQQGLLNNLLIWLGIIDQPLEILHTDTAVYIGIVYSYLPFMILPLYATLEKLDGSLLEAAEDLGCRPWKAFLLITLPLSLPGIIAGSLLVFIPAVGEYVIPELLGGIDTLMIGKVLSNEFFQNTDWPVASAVAIVLLLVLVIPITVFQYVQAKQQEAEQ